MLKLIINNPHLLNGNVLSQGDETKQTSLKNLFMFDFQEFSSNLYIFRAKDLDHELLCEMTLELKESLACPEGESEEETYLARVITCNFPSINVQKFNEKIGFDAYLQGIVTFQFQLKILEQLFLFCEEKDAVNLILTINGADLDYLEIYSRFITSEKQVTTSKGQQTEIVIPADVDIYDEVVDLMNEIDKDFRKTLWREQNVNPIFREYLKEHFLSGF